MPPVRRLLSQSPNDEKTDDPRILTSAPQMKRGWTSLESSAGAACANADVDCTADSAIPTVITIALPRVNNYRRGRSEPVLPVWLVAMVQILQQLPSMASAKELPKELTM